MLDISIPDMTALINFLERRTMVLYAGSMAEALNSTGTDGDNEKALSLLEGAEGADDSAKAREVQRILTAVTCKDGDFANVLKDHHDRLWIKAGMIVEKYGPNIVEISKICREILGGLSEVEISKEQIEKIPSWAEIERGIEQAVLTER